MRQAFGIIALLLWLSGCGGTAGTSPVAPATSGTLLITVVENPAGAGVAATVFFSMNNEPFRTARTDTGGVLRLPDLPYGTYAIRVDAFGFAREERAVEVNAPETAARFGLAPADDVEVTELYADGVRVYPGGSIPRTGHLLFRGRHRQVTHPWPATQHFIGSFLSPMSPFPDGTLFAGGAGAKSVNLTATTWEAVVPNWNARCDACTATTAIQTLLLNLRPSGALDRVADRVTEWPLTIR